MTPLQGQSRREKWPILAQTPEGRAKLKSVRLEGKRGGRKRLLDTEPLLALAVEDCVFFSYLTTDRSNQREPIKTKTFYQRYEQDNKVRVTERRTEPGVESIGTEDLLDTVRGCLACCCFLFPTYRHH